MLLRREGNGAVDEEVSATPFKTSSQVCFLPEGEGSGRL